MLGRMGHGVRGKTHVGRIDSAIAEQVAVMMQALATPSRVLILARLRESPHAVGELAAAVGMELSAVSHQLRLLRQLGLVVGEGHGRQIVYALHDSHVADLLDDAAYHLEHTCGSVIGSRSSAPRDTTEANSGSARARPLARSP